MNDLGRAIDLCLESNPPAAQHTTPMEVDGVIDLTVRTRQVFNIVDC